jgi:ketosteroid isomerase-like protein
MTRHAITVALAVLAWSSPLFASESDEIAKLTDKQANLGTGAEVYVDDAPIVATIPNVSLGRLTSAGELVEMLAPPSTSVGGEDAKDRQIGVARDGKSAWATFTVRVSVQDSPQLYRVSDLLVKTSKGWRVAAIAWTAPVANDRVNKQAKAGDRSFDSLVLEVKNSDATLVAAFKKLATDGVDRTAAARKELVAVGSGPGERTTGGAVLAKAWSAAWVKHVTVSSAVAQVAPSGTTGWVIAKILLDKKSYKVQFLVFCVFDKTAAGDWSLVHIQFAA